jgi:hypothetical protein
MQGTVAEEKILMQVSHVLIACHDVSTARTEREFTRQVRQAAKQAKAV